MPSNEDIISTAVEKAVGSNETINLLLISDTLDNINGESVTGSTDYGMHYNFLYIGMSGQRMVDQMNSNWEATDAQFLAHNNALNIRIISNQIKEIKMEDDILYYTTDLPPKEDEEDTRSWIPVQSSWGKIVGNIADQKDLQLALSEKVDSKTFNELSITVSSNSTNIINLKSSVNSISTTLSSLVSAITGVNGVLYRLSNVEESLAKKISSEDVIEIRANENGSLEYTLNGTDWHSVSSAGAVDWGDIYGDIANQADLQAALNTLTKSINTLSTSLSSHEKNTENPHSVTASQVGLGNVDNTSDKDKPVSTPQRQAIDKVFENVSMMAMTKEEFEALEEYSSDILYFIIDD